MVKQRPFYPRTYFRISQIPLTCVRLVTSMLSMHREVRNRTPRIQMGKIQETLRPLRPPILTSRPYLRRPSKQTRTVHKRTCSHNSLRFYRRARNTQKATRIAERILRFIYRVKCKIKQIVTILLKTIITSINNIYNSCHQKCILPNINRITKTNS